MGKWLLLFLHSIASKSFLLIYSSGYVAPCRVSNTAHGSRKSCCAHSPQYLQHELTLLVETSYLSLWKQNMACSKPILCMKLHTYRHPWTECKHTHTRMHARMRTNANTVWPSSSFSPNCINLINVDNTRSSLPGLFEQVPHSGCTKTWNESGTTNPAEPWSWNITTVWRLVKLWQAMNQEFYNRHTNNPA